MTNNNVKKVYVIGHKNPDTDSICSAIAYSNLKNKISDLVYEPKRAGQLNEETQFVLNKFKMGTPKYLSDVRPQVKDIEVREVPGVSSNLSLKKAWDMMRAARYVTLPIIKDRVLEGVITISDIATSDMDVYDSKILATANTQYTNVVETLDGDMVVGDIQSFFNEGKVIIAAANPDVMESYINEGDMVILGNRYESQLCAIEMGAACLVICMDTPVSLTIKKLALEKGCNIIQTPHDTYTVARLMNHSMPIGYFMTKRDLITFKAIDFADDVQRVMASKRFRDFPVLDNKGHYVGMISRRSLLNLNRKQLILVDHNEKSQAVDGYETAEILEIIDHHRLGNIETVGPVFFRNQPVGCTATIVTQMYRENNVAIEPQIAGLLCSAIISDTLMYRSPTCTPMDKATAQDLAVIAGISVEEYAKEMFEAGSNLKHKSPEEIFYQDFKKFSAPNTSFGVGQITSMNADELAEIKSRLIPYMEKAFKEHGVDMLFFMLTNIMDESTLLLVKGAEAVSTIQNAFGVVLKDNAVTLEHVVSRKKQLIPPIMTALQQ